MWNTEVLAKGRYLRRLTRAFIAQTVIDRNRPQAIPSCCQHVQQRHGIAAARDGNAKRSIRDVGKGGFQPFG